MPENTTLNLSEQEQIRREKLSKYQADGRDPYTITRFDRTHTSADILARFDQLENQTVRIAGRMMSRRIMGKASFVHLLDGEGQIQVYVRREDVGEDVYADFKTMDIGDILGIEGFVFRTKTGEVSVHAQKLVLLTKSLRVLPEKWNGLKDQDIRYRQRYCQPRGKGHLYQAQPDFEGSARVSGRQGLPGGGHPRFADHRNRGQFPLLCYPPQRAGHSHVSAY